MGSKKLPAEFQGVVRHADALDRMLLNAVDENRLGESCHFENSWRDIDHMMELAADFTLSLNPLRPVHDRTVTRAAKVRSHLMAAGGRNSRIGGYLVSGSLAS